ncbi:MAG: hypothetical protein M1817_000196 [Caeruleum heppii]|nr:MAG: hypothetical protein M1817_000196 [Caeruleum heppii]
MVLRLCWQSVLAFLLLVAITSAADLNAWEVDLDTDDAANGCKAHKDELQTAYDESAEMVKKALEAIDVIKAKRPQRTRDSMEKVLDWDRRARLFTSFFGVHFKPDEDLGGDSVEPFDTVEEVYRRMARLFDTGRAKVYTNKFTKPAIACGDQGWKFIEAEGEDIGDPAKRKLSETKKTDTGDPEFPDGAWYWKNRYFMAPTSTPQSVGICRPNVVGVTQVAFDMVTFCDSVWGNPTLEAGADGATALSTKLDDIARTAASRTVIHEFAHFFGFGGFTTGAGDLPDHQAVNHENRPIWLNAAGDARTVNKPSDDAKPALTYFFTDCVNLAHHHPEQAINTAETFAYYAAGMFADQFDWSQNFAQVLPEAVSEPVLPRSLRAVVFSA